jgi:hypothetical protein
VKKDIRPRWDKIGAAKSLEAHICSKGNGYATTGKEKEKV